MAQKKEDLRVIKTKRSIKTEFYALLQKKPVEKISVKELCENAMINKGTFYLHYTDIYALYREVVADTIEEKFSSMDYYGEFFTAPRSFVKKFLVKFGNDSLDPRFSRFPHMDPTKERLFIPRMVDEALLDHILGTGYVADTPENRARVLCCISAMITPLICYGKSYTDVIAEAAGDMTATTVEAMLKERHQ